MTFFTDLEAVRERWNVLEHPFYTRWSAGELTREELASYSGQYRRAVIALADASAAAARCADDETLRSELGEHAREEAAHVELWDRFTAAIGGDTEAEATPETQACAEAWAAERPLLASLVALYAIESGQPAISETKRIGLVEHYGAEPGSDLTAYFDLHAVRDVEHAAQERALIEPLITGADVDALLAEAESVLRANWELLDGVERLNGRS
jgi:pyrroloquinoline-quinone synthase